MIQYGNLSPSPMNPGYQIRFLKVDVPRYLELINKYKAWRRLAMSRRDAFDKVIGKAPAWGQVNGVELKFTFHSANEQQDLLMISTCAAGTCLDNKSLAFDAANVDRLENLLQTWSSRGLPSLEVNSVYH